MIRRSSFFSLFIAILAIGTLAQEKDKKKAGMPTGKPVMWEQIDTASLDLLAGPGGEAMKPDLSKITFIEEQKGGFSTKYRIKDGSGKVWVAKIGDEAQSETAAVRLIWALGYKTEVNYLVPEITIPGKGTFKNVRLEARPESVDRGESWSWKDNEFKGSREFQGLKIMMAFLNNWDMKQDNNVIMTRNGRQEYVISDLGVSFGKTGSNGLPIFWRLGRSRNVPEHFAEAEFIEGMKNGKISFNFNGKNDGSLGDVTVEDGRWLVERLAALSDAQIADAFRAANYSDAEVAILKDSVRSRIRSLELVTSRGSSAPAGK